MEKSYTTVMQQIESLTREAERLKRKEVDAVIARIKEAIDTYGLTAGDLGLGGQSNGKLKPTAKTTRARRKVAPKRSVKFRDDAGNTWVGRGPRPQWLRDALANGRSLQDFAA